jgi:hypothetical protein
VVDRLVERTGGNPLALLELPGTLEPGQLAGRAPLEDVLPLTARLEETFGERVRGLPTEARTILLVAAVETGGDPAVALPAGARLGVGPEALEDAESAGLVRTGGRRAGALGRPGPPARRARRGRRRPGTGGRAHRR